MAATPTSLVSAARRKSLAVRHHGADSGQAIAAERELRFERAKHELTRAIDTPPSLTAEQVAALRELLLEEHIAEVVSKVPPLTAEQAARLRALLPGPARSEREAVPA